MLVQFDRTMVGILVEDVDHGPWPPACSCDLVVEHMQSEAGQLTISAHSTSRTATCPTCGSSSGRVHSTYQRSLMDLPAHGQAVWIEVSARRFRCVLATCGQRIFTERLAATASRPFARRTARLEGIVHHLGLALGGRPGQSFARRLLLPVSQDIIDAWVAGRKHIPALIPTSMPMLVPDPAL
jgi:zinc-finger of transposase IS204/IS1001/IS1096/IS1165